VDGGADDDQSGDRTFGRCQNDSSPEDRAVAFLTREVPLWFEENGCFSCHNNGDAARVLYQNKKRGRARLAPFGISNWSPNP
jgi:hypothetical protein